MAFRRLGILAARYRWPILGAWLALAVALNIVIPQLSDVIRRDAVPFLPDSAPVMQAYKVDGEKFNGSDARGYAVLENPRGITAGDEAWYGNLARRIAADRRRVLFVNDYVSHPEFRDAARSRDGRSIYLPVGLRAPVGSPPGDSDAGWLRGMAATGRPADLSVHVTGDTAIIADFQDSIQKSTARTAVITVLLVMVILLAIYRSPVTPVIPLTTIGISIMVVRPLVALMGLHVIKVAAFTETFLLAIVFGAGTDYCIFMISRFKEQMARGEARGKAIASSSRRVGGAITCSAATVMVGGLAMMPANVSLFSTTGPAIAMAVAVTLIAGLTLTPALIAIGGDRFFWPGHLGTEKPSRFWNGAAALIARRPGRVLAASLVPLVLLALLYPTMRITYDERSPQPASNDSMQGLAALDRHFRTGEVIPDQVLVVSDHDIRNLRDLSAIDGATRSLAKVDAVESVRSFTQPTGGRLQEASVSQQVGQVGQGLREAHDKLEQGSAGVGQLDAGATQISNGASQLASGARQAAGATDLFIGGIAREDAGLQAAVSGSRSAQAGAGQLRDGATRLAAGLRAMRGGIQQSVNGMDQVLLYFDIDPDPGCRFPPNGHTPCQDAHGGLTTIDDAQKSQILPGLDQAIAGADRIAAGDGDLASGLAALQDGLQRADAAMRQLENGERTFKQRLGELAGGAGLLSGGAAQLGGGVSQLAGGSAQLTAGLGQASQYLSTLSREATQAGIDPFYIPASRLDDPRLALARYYYVSRDGTTARLLVFASDDPFDVAAMNRVDRERTAVETALKGTSLAGARVMMAGDAPLNESLRDLFSRDFRVVAVAVMLGVLLVLVLLLRSLLAPLYLLASVLLSYAAAMGITTLVWQNILHKGAVDWTVGIFAFMMLVSVGADYNIFLMSRVREEVLRDPVSGIQHAVARTGAIITSAGVIFAGTFAALVSSPLTNVAETGFAITCGLLLDTFLVRSFLVPALAVLLGRWNWWPQFGLPAGRVAQLELSGHPRPWPGGGVRVAR